MRQITVGFSLQGKLIFSTDVAFGEKKENKNGGFRVGPSRHPLDLLLPQLLVLLLLKPLSDQQ